MATRTAISRRRAVYRADESRRSYYKNWRARRHAFERPREDFDGVRFVPLRGVTRFAGGAAFQIAAKIFRRDRDARRTAVNHAADRRPVAFAEGRYAKKLSERVAGH